VILTPTTWPRLFRAVALLRFEPKVPRSVITASSQRNAWKRPSPVPLWPTTCPPWLSAVDPGRGDAAAAAGGGHEAVEAGRKGRDRDGIPATVPARAGGIPTRSPNWRAFGLPVMDAIKAADVNALAVNRLALR